MIYLESNFGNRDKNKHVQFDLEILFWGVFPKYGTHKFAKTYTGMFTAGLLL